MENMNILIIKATTEQLRTAYADLAAFSGITPKALTASVKAAVESKGLNFSELTPTEIYTEALEVAKTIQNSRNTYNVASFSTCRKELRAMAKTMPQAELIETASLMGIDLTAAQVHYLYNSKTVVL